MEEKIKHLEFVQNVITRLNNNSFQLKGWMITIVSALMALYASSGKVLYIFVSILPVIIFWFIDTYYLLQERKFRGMYADIVNGKVKDFNMPIENYTFSKQNNKKYKYLKVLFSETMWPLYLLLILALALGGILIILFCK